MAMITEGTHVEVSRATDESTVHERASEVIKRCHNLVIADFGPRNLERLLTFRDIAKDCGRKLVVTAKDIYLLKAISLAGGQFLPPEQDDVIAVYDELKKPDKWEEEILFQYAGRLVNAGMARKDSGSYILCFSFWDINELVEIDPEPGAIYIYSSSEAYDEEQRFDMLRLRNWLNTFGVQPVGLPDANTGKLAEGEQRFHASGHITGPDLLDVISTIDPEFVIPVHTENIAFFREHIKPEKLLVPVRGQPIDL